MHGRRTAGGGVSKLDRIEREAVAVGGAVPVHGLQRKDVAILLRLRRWAELVGSRKSLRVAGEQAESARDVFRAAVDQAVAIDHRPGIAEGGKPRGRQDS